MIVLLSIAAMLFFVACFCAVVWLVVRPRDVLAMARVTRDSGWRKRNARPLWIVAPNRRRP